MSGTQPVAVYASKVPTGDVMVPAVPDFAAMFRLSMAAIDPTAEPEYEDGNDKKPPRSTLKLIRVPNDMLDDDEDDDDESEAEEGEEMNGGPSNPSKAKKATSAKQDKATAAGKDQDEDEDSDLDEAAAKAALSKLAKGKGKAIDAEDSEDDEDDGLELEEVVVCTLDPEKNAQQPLDIVVGEDEKIFFKVSGTHEVHLTGNYVIPMDDNSAGMFGGEDEEDYDLSPDEMDEDDVRGLLDAADEDESDGLDDMEDPRITEVDTDDEPPKLVKQDGKGKKKRPAEDSDEDDNLDDMMGKSIKSSEPTVNGDEKPLSKSQKKKLKKVKKNDGEAADVEMSGPGAKKEKKAAEGAKAQPASNGEKKVQFAKKLEQGPTESKLGHAAKTNGAITVKTVQGVTIEDRKTGTGPQAKKGSQVEMRYIGKLEDGGKVFDANKKGKPFSFKVGAGEVIKGWDIGVAGLAAGGERRLIIPANLAYGSKGAPPKIPPNSKLIFDVKMLGVK